jgi:hypothetical protein
MAELVIGTYRHDDESEVLAVLQLALGESLTSPRTPEFWRWKHFNNPFGESLLFVARIGNRIAGLRAYLQWRFRSPAGELRALRAVDTATHPEHVRKGIFRTLTLEANRRAEAAGFDLIFNTPNEKSRPGYLSMGWKAVGRPRAYVRPLRLPRRSAESRDPAEIIPLGDVPEFTGFVDRDPLGLRTARSDRYLRWRFGHHPAVAYRSVTMHAGQALFRANRRNGRSEAVASELLGRGSIGLAIRGLDADYVVGSARPDSPEARTMRRAGFLPIPGRGLTLVALPLTPAATPALSLSAWDLSAGDLELM